MIKPEQVPEASWRIACDVLGDLNVYSAEMKAAIAAALNAWPGMREGGAVDNKGYYDTIILPLTQENENE